MRSFRTHLAPAGTSLHTTPREPSRWPRCRRKACARRGEQLDRITDTLARCPGCGAERGLKPLSSGPAISEALAARHRTAA